jgi:hypothetical protein
MSKIDNIAQGFINALFHGKKYVRFIHVGVSDGFNSDFVRWRATSFEWIGILIEANPIYFKMEIEAYKDYSNLLWENIAISESDNEKELYYIFKRFDFEQKIIES